MELKNAYHRMCLQVHPDVATRERRSSEKFIALRREYEEAMTLRKLGYIGAYSEGIVPPSYSSSRSGSTTTVGGYGPATNPAQRHSKWTPHIHRQTHATYSHPYPVEDVIREFDLHTRIAGTLIVVTSLTLGLLVLREFLVATAGSFWAYHYGAWSNFYIRRYTHRADYLGPKRHQVLRRTTSDHSDFYERRLNKGMSRAEKNRTGKIRGEATPAVAAAAAATVVEATTGHDNSSSSTSRDDDGSTSEAGMLVARAQSDNTSTQAHASDSSWDLLLNDKAKKEESLREVTSAGGSTSTPSCENPIRGAALPNRNIAAAAGKDPEKEKGHEAAQN